MYRRTTARMGQSAFLLVLLLVPVTQAADLAEAFPPETALWVALRTGPEQQTHPLFASLEALRDSGFDVIKGEGPEYELLQRLRKMMRAFEEPGHLAVGLIDVAPPTNGPPRFDVAAVIDGALVEPTEALLGEMGRMADEEPRMRTLAAHQMQVLDLDDGVAVLFGRHEEMLVVALSDVAAEKVLRCLAGEAEGLPANENFEEARDAARSTDRDEFAIFVDVERILTRVREVAEEAIGGLPPIAEQLIHELGLDAVRAKYLRTTQFDDRPRTNGVALIDGELRGLLKLWDQEPLTEADLAVVPREAYWAQVSNLDLAAVWAEAMRVVEAIDPSVRSDIAGGVAMSSQMLGFSITDDLLPALGDTWVFYDAPRHGGLLLTGSVMVAEVREPDNLRMMLRRIVQLAVGLSAQQEVRLVAGQKEVMGVEVEYVLVGGLPVPVTPAWAFVEDRWVFGLYPETVALAARQVQPTTRQAGIATHPQVQAALTQLPTKFQSFGYLDNAYLARLMYPLVRGLNAAAIAMAAGGDDPVATMDDLVLREDVLGRATSYVGVIARADDGLHFAAIGDGNLVLVSAAAAGTGAAITLPAMLEARETARGIRSLTNLRQIGMAVSLYATENDGRCPESLFELVEGGYITRGVLRAEDGPPGGGGSSYDYVGCPGELSAIPNPAKYIVVHEKFDLDFDDVGVVFADGSALRLSESIVRELLAAQRAGQ
jgi:hypothetical protein